MKKVITGWIENRYEKSVFYSQYDAHVEITLDKRKGERADWLDWPPVKVTITVETAE
jgi:hypothetical protein